jgi:Na(+)-translocating NADH:ubiquinone oxidoreductase C subunit
MVLLTVFYISILASIRELTKQRVEKNKRIQNARSIMYACNFYPKGLSEEDFSPTSTTDDIPWDSEYLFQVMKERLEMVRLAISEEDRKLLQGSFLSIKDSVTIYLIKDNEARFFAYGFLLRGKGLWGTISAFGVVNADLNKMIGIDFTEQVETPGLGARITENAFKKHFRNLDLSGFSRKNADKDGLIMVSNKPVTNQINSTNSVESITGATQTCNGVLKMLNIDLNFYISLLKRNHSTGD